MRTIYTQFSGLAGLLAFLNQLWSYAPLERSVLIGFGTAIGVYLLLMLGDVTINRILAHTPPALADKAAGVGDPNASDVSEKTETAKAA